MFAAAAENVDHCDTAVGLADGSNYNEIARSLALWSKRKFSAQTQIKINDKRLGESTQPRWKKRMPHIITSRLPTTQIPKFIPRKLCFVWLWFYDRQLSIRWLFDFFVVRRCGYGCDVHKPMPNCEAILIEDEEKINFFPHFELWSLLQIHIFSLFAGWEDER